MHERFSLRAASGSAPTRRVEAIGATLTLRRDKPSATDRVNAIAARVQPKGSISPQGLSANVGDTAVEGKDSVGKSPPATPQWEVILRNVIGRTVEGGERHAVPDPTAD